MRRQISASSLFIFLCIILCVSPSIFSQSKETGALQGTILLEDGSPVPGVMVKLTSSNVAGASKTTISNDSGKYRFIGLIPGSYTVSAILEGFASAKQEDIKVSIGKTFTVDLTLQQGKITEEIVVSGKSALVDVKDSSTASVEMSTEFLQNVPNSQFTVDAVNLAPGIFNDVAYGSASGTGVAYQIDGVDVSDPAGGSAWVFLDYNVVEEISISGIGAPAEYGGFTGVVFNTITKSGDNEFKGYGEFLYQGKEWNSSNSDNPDFAAGKVEEYSIHIDVGGPIIKDKLTYFASFLMTRELEGVSGNDYDIDYKQPKGFLKFSWQPTAKTRFNTFIEYDQYNGSGRNGDAKTELEATVNQESPETVANFSIQHLFSDYTFVEAKIAYFSGYYELVPYGGRDLPGHTDWSTNEYTVNAITYYKGERSRLQANASITHHADNFMGTHDFKFGTDMLHVTLRDQYGYNGGTYYADMDGEPYFRRDWEGYDTRATMSTVSVYAQDSWSINDRLTINPGVRIDWSWGSVEDIPGTEYKTRPGIAPRIGFSYDIFGDHTTAVKAHWGRYFEKPLIRSIISLSNTTTDKSEYYYIDNEWVLDYFQPGGSQYIIDDKLDQSYMDQFTVGIERELIKDLSLGVTFISRTNKDHIAPINIGGEYELVPYYNEFTGQTYTVWNQTNDRTENLYLITNPKKGDLPWMQFSPERKYTGLEILLNKRFSNNWQLMASYVYGRATGNFNNTQSSAAGYSGIYENPNNQINTQGHLEYDPTHMFKIQGTVILPYDINLNANFYLISGNTYTLEARLPNSVDVNRSTIFLESRGSHRYPTRKNLDLRLEKSFKLGDVKLGVLLDIFNIFNEGYVTEYSTSDTSFQDVLRITSPRAFRAGLRVWF